MINHSIKTEKIRRGEYIITRETDGRKFRIRRLPGYWSVNNWKWVGTLHEAKCEIRWGYKGWAAVDTSAARTNG